MADENLRFTSHVGHQPTFFVPDTGAPGATAVLTTPKGKTVEFTGVPVKSRRDPDSGEALGTFGPRVGIKVPERFGYEGEYTLAIDQDGTVTTYVIDVGPRRYWNVNERSGKRELLIGVVSDEPEEEV